MSRRSGPWVLALLPLLLTGLAQADVFKYTDAAGHVYYTDKPDHSGYRLIIRTPAAFSKPAKLLAKSRIWRPPVSLLPTNRHQFASVIEQAANRYSLDPALLHAVIRAESGYNPKAVSHKGAVGLMQLMPGTAARYGVADPWDPEENIYGGARYLSDLIDMFGSDLRLVVAAYNAGENNVIKYGNSVPPFRETQEYVSRVLTYYRRSN